MSCRHCPRSGDPCRGAEVPRLCQLVDPDHAAFNPAYRGLLVPTPAAGPGPDNPPDRHGSDARRPGVPGLAESLRLTVLSRRCPFRSKPACSCTGAAACALKGGVDVPAPTCWDCVRRYGS